ncbi:MAG: Rpn family recombination-promoting nuclease/putative transposase [Prevotellaceae bacterium]|jgi:predicted transposase/invertase (TIGR01784 family)|nr:Rpn family recombination-promoting nuclease/putative transposase [Prevotellaceae bacterium]
MSKFINPLTDYGWKILFGQETNKSVLIELLNSLLEGEVVIEDLIYLDKEQLPEVPDERMFVYDIYCRTSTGEYIIIEIQRESQEYFKDRALVYTSAAILKQAKKGTWIYKLDAVYGIFFLDFRLPENEYEGAVIHVDMTTRKTHRVFNPKQRQIFISLPAFDLQEDECKTKSDRWIYVLKNMETLDHIPFIDDMPVMRRLEKTIALTSMDPNQRGLYEASLKAYRDNYAVISYKVKKGIEEGMAKGMAKGIAKGRAEGMTKGIAKGRAEGIAIGEARSQAKLLDTARNLKAAGVATEIIINATGLSREVIEQL